MHVISNQPPAASGLPGITHATLAGSEHGLSKLSVWRQSLAAGAGTPPHRHDCEEVVLCTAGEGELHIDGMALRFGADTTVVIPRNAEHQIVNAGSGPLQFVAIFSAAPVEAYFPDNQPIALPWRS